MPHRRDPETGLCRRGSTNRDRRGSTESRRRRRAYLVETYRADVDALVIPRIQVHNNDPAVQVVGECPLGTGVPACRCYRCGGLLVEETVSADKIVPQWKKTTKYPNGGTYARENIRPACDECQSKVGGAMTGSTKKTKTRTLSSVKQA